MGRNLQGKPTIRQQGANETAGNNGINHITSFVRFPCTIVNSSTTSHYLMLDSTCVNKQPSAQPISVTLPNRDSIVSTHEAHLPFPHLPHQAINAHIFPALHSHALLSVSTFCDAGCMAEFTAGELKIKYKGETVLLGVRIPPRLWQINLNYKHTLCPQEMAPTPACSKAMPSSSSMQLVSALPPQHGPRLSIKVSAIQFLY
jgi:hypothetical protein